jgi:hypothetical protein
LPPPFFFFFVGMLYFDFHDGWFELHIELASGIPQRYTRIERLPDATDQHQQATRLPAGFLVSLLALFSIVF